MNNGKKDSLPGLGENIESALCYLGLWVTGLIFYLISHKNKKIRFHAAQSLIFFGIVFIVKVALSFIPLIGKVFASTFNFIEAACAVIFALIAFNKTNEFNIPLISNLAKELSEAHKLP